MRRGFYCLRPLTCHFKKAFWSLCIFRAQMAIIGVLGLSGLFRNGLVQFDHPYIFILHGSVLFLQGLLGRRRRLSRLGLWRGRYRHSHSQKVRNPLFWCGQWCPMVAERQMETVYFTFRQRNWGFQVYFGVFKVWLNREGQGTMVCINKEIWRDG